MKTNKLEAKRNLLVFLCLLLITNSLALDVNIFPVQETTTNIENKDCGGETQALFKIISDEYGGVLCWYSTSDNPDRVKLTTSCVRPFATASYAALLSMPSAGSKKVSVQLECYDFWWGNDKCVDGYTYSQALANKYSGGAEGVIALRYFSLSCSKMQVNAVASEESISLNCGDSRDVGISVSNLGENTIECSYSGGSIGRISPGGKQSFYVNIKAPSSGSGTTSQSVPITCIDDVTNQQSETETTISVRYSPNPCFAKIETATATYNNAIEKNTEADTVIQGAESRCEGSDKTEAIGFKNQVDSYLSTARSILENSRKSCANGDTDNGINQADDAKNKAELAINYATQTKNAIEKAVKDCLGGRKDASDLLNQADSKIRSCESWIERADSVVKNGSDLGMDTHQEKADVETARSTIANAKTYQGQASSYFDGKDYSMAKKDAKDAITKAEDAETFAKKAHNSLFKTVEDASTAKIEMGLAAVEIAKADQIFAKLAVVVRNMKENTNITGIEAQISGERSKIESSRDYSSQAQNKFSAGYFSESVNLATNARDTAAGANNRLSRLVEGFTVTVTGSLEKNAKIASSEVDDANSKIKEASTTYAASGNEITAAGESIQAAKIALNDAKTIISKAKATTDLTEFLNLASDGFTKLKTVSQKASDAKLHASTAINLGYASISAAVAGTVGVGGAGFLFWRRKKSNRAKKEERVHTKVEREAPIDPKNKTREAQKEEQVQEKINLNEAKSEAVGASIAKIAHAHKAQKEALECPKCGVLKENMGAKFCEECGSSLRKKIPACPQCNSKVSHKDKFCINCGEKLEK